MTLQAEQTFSSNNVTYDFENNSLAAEFPVSFGDEFFITQDVVYPIYLSYMAICCGIGLTGNAMVWILIR